MKRIPNLLKEDSDGGDELEQQYGVTAPVPFKWENIDLEKLARDFEIKISPICGISYRNLRGKITITLAGSNRIKIESPDFAAIQGAKVFKTLHITNFGSGKVTDAELGWFSPHWSYTHYDGGSNGCAMEIRNLYVTPEGKLCTWEEAKALS